MSLFATFLATFFVAVGAALAGAPGETPPALAPPNAASPSAPESEDAASGERLPSIPSTDLGSNAASDAVLEPVVEPVGAAVNSFSGVRPGKSRVHLFRVQRNKNRNEVHYWIDVDRDCRPLGVEPVGNHWLKLESGPDVVRPLSSLQQTAYGFRSQRRDGDSVIVELRAVPERALRVVLDARAADCRADTSIVIDGEPAWLDRVWVEAREGLFGILPDVQYIDLHGRAADGEDLTERLRR